MTFDEHLKRAFSTLTDHLREEIGRHTEQSVDALTKSIAADREKAVGDAVAQARADAQRTAAAQSATAAATARDEGHTEGYELGKQHGREEGIEEGVQTGTKNALEQARRESEDAARQAQETARQGQEAARQQGHELGHQEGLEQGRRESQEVLSHVQETTRLESHELGRKAGHEQGTKEGFEQGRAEGFESGRQQGLEVGRKEGIEIGRGEGLEVGRKDGVGQGFAQGLAQGREEGRQEGFAEGRKTGEEHGRKMAEDASRESLDAAVAAAHAGNHSADLAASERLIEAIRAIDRARSLSEILDTLVNGASKEAGRVGIWLVRAGQFHCWRMIGFDLSGGAESELAGIGESGINDADGVGGTVVPFPRVEPVQAAADVGFDDAGVMAEALRSGTAASGDGEGHAGPPAFAALPAGRESLAIPIAMGAQVVGVLYADQGSSANRDPKLPATWPETLEVLTRHAARCLEALTAFKAARALTERPGVPEMDVLQKPGSLGIGGGPPR